MFGKENSSGKIYTKSYTLRFTVSARYINISLYSLVNNLSHKICNAKLKQCMKFKYMKSIKLMS